jgi:hypothetical protein
VLASVSTSTTPGDAEHAERHDERRRLAVGDEHAVEDANRGARRQAAKDRHRDPRAVHEQLGGDAARQAEHRADREVDAGGQDHEQLADGDVS